MSIAINNNFERDQLIASFTGQTQFVYSFPIYSETYLTVYQRGFTETPDDPTQVLTLGVDYTVTGVGEEAGGYINLTAGATFGDIITIVGSQPIQRESVFQDLNPFTVALNQQLNQMTIMMQQNFTYWSNLSPHYNFDELVSAPSGLDAGVRPFKLILPMLPDGHVWVGRGALGTIPDDITTMPLPTTPGGGGGTTHEITQPGEMFTVGQWVRIDVASGLYMLALADNKVNAEVAGVVIASNISAGTFTVQQSGYIDGALGVFSGLNAGEPQFLSPTVLGAMQAIDTTIEEQVSRPVFLPDSASGGWVLPYRGFINNGSADNANDNNILGEPSITIVTQTGHGFSVGDVLYVIPPTSAEAKYDLAKADNFATSQVAGIVISVLNPSQFVLQFSGYNVQTATEGTITTDDLGAPLVASTVYYLSSTVAGKVSSTNPTTTGTFSRPVLISERTALTSGLYSAWILPQRPLDLSATGGTNPVIKTITQANTFAPGNFLYISADDTYALAIADTLDHAQVAGVVVTATPADFTIQQSGFVNGAVTAANIDGGVINSAVCYYLSDMNAGNLTATVPGVGAISKPCYIQQTAAGNIGELLPQRPLLVANPIGPGTGWSLISSVTAANQPNVDLVNMSGFYRYMIIFENVIPVTNAVALNFVVSTDNGITWDTTAGDYAWNGVVGTAGTFNPSDNKINLVGDYIPGRLQNIVARGGLSGEMQTINPANNLYWKMFYFSANYMISTNNVNGMYSKNGCARVTAPINALRFFMTSGNILSGTIKLYGTNV
jgi:hypothetical protein